MKRPNDGGDSHFSKQQRFNPNQSSLDRSRGYENGYDATPVGGSSYNTPQRRANVPLQPNYMSKQGPNFEAESKLHKVLSTHHPEEMLMQEIVEDIKHLEEVLKLYDNVETIEEVKILIQSGTELLLDLKLYQLLVLSYQVCSHCLVIHVP